MSKFVKVPAKNCLRCYFYETCILDGVGTELDLNEHCEKGFVWKLEK